MPTDEEEIRRLNHIPSQEEKDTYAEFCRLRALYAGVHGLLYGTVAGVALNFLAIRYSHQFKSRMSLKMLIMAMSMGAGFAWKMETESVRCARNAPWLANNNIKRSYKTTSE